MKTLFFSFSIRFLVLFIVDLVELRPNNSLHRSVTPLKRFDGSIISLINLKALLHHFHRDRTYVSPFYKGYCKNLGEHLNMLILVGIRVLS